ncbi:uncharacterized protein LOC113796501 [Dermatophagoides pteronyssinus]|uniref:Uncharacterized protein LOC113796501 n=1 Tax=Dermatophagoides pteronyssinus TaxID=6956 RepID=A0A6P6YBD0_DERPT|nr:uncharacterized protein LOC113796501 [Dermatophagoides pteronyssinus]
MSFIWPSSFSSSKKNKNNHLSSIILFYIIIIIIIFICQIIDCEFQKCTPDFCRIQKCSDKSCKGDNKILFHNVTTCGCCNECVEELEENVDCVLEMKGIIPDTQCGPHLKCVRKTKNTYDVNAICRKISDIENENPNGEHGCEYENKRFDQNRFQMQTYSLRPECDQFGDYKIRQCKNGTLCQCVKQYKDDKTGKIKTRPIFGTDIYTNADKMNCLCSYQFENVNEKLREMIHSLNENKRWDLLPETEKYNQHYDIDPIFFIRCQSNGNFERYQSYGNYSYCIDEITGQVQDRPVLMEHASELPCYSHRYPFKRSDDSCISKYNNSVNEYYKLQNENGYNVVAFDLPNCDLDGTYAPIQCENNKCYCVNKQGKKYRGTIDGKRFDYGIDRNDQYFGSTQQCTCLRNKNLIRDIRKRDKITELFSKYQCDINGNYLPLQCSNTDCYCVNPITGYAILDERGSMQIALKTDLEQIHHLKCYQDYPDKKRLDKSID